MYEFLSTLSEIVLPRIKEFNGIKMSKRGNLGVIAFGLPDSAITLFPEIEGKRFYIYIFFSHFVLISAF